MEFQNNSNLKKEFWALLRTGIITGLFIVVPIIVTVWVGWWSLSFLTDWAVQILQNTVPLAVDYPGATILIRIVTILTLTGFVFGVGLLARVTLGKKMILYFQRLLLRIPILSIVYSTCEQIGETVKTQQGGLFKQVVLFEYPKKGSWAIGFVTNFNKEPFEVSNHLKDGFYSIFMPTTPNPTSGFLIFIPAGECILLNMSVGEAMRLIVSGGVILPGSKVNQDSSAKS